MKTATCFLLMILTFTVSNNTGCGSQAPPPLPPARTVTLLLDKTGSSSLNEFPRFANALREAILQQSNFNWKIGVVNLGANGDGPWSAEVIPFAIPSFPVNDFDEKKEREKARKGPCGSRKNCIDKIVEEIRKQKSEEFENRKKDYLKERDETFRKMTDEILRAPVKEPACSDIQAMSDRAGRSPGDVILITDADHNCNDQFNGLEFKNNVLVALASLKNEKPGEYTKRLAQLSQKLNTDNIIPAATIDLATITKFLDTK